MGVSLLPRGDGLLVVDNCVMCGEALGTGEEDRDETALCPSPGEEGVGVMDLSEESTEDGFLSLASEEVDDVLL